MTSRPNIIWITLESIRADHTTLQNYKYDTTPNLQQIARTGSGVGFSNCYAHARWTPASSTSILTGTYLSTHGVGFEDTTNVRRVPRELKTAPELLSAEGYRTAFFSTNPYASTATRLDRGFDLVHTNPQKRDFISLPGIATAKHYLLNLKKRGAGFERNPRWHRDCLYPLYQTKKIENWVSSLEKKQEPYFIYTHMNGSHLPYSPPLSFIRHFVDSEIIDAKEAIRIAKSVTDNIWQIIADGCNLSIVEEKALQAAYDAEIAYHDYLVGLLFKHIRENCTENTIFIVTADHGDLFGEQGIIGHNLSLHDGLIHVPLVTYGLENVDHQKDNIVQHIDVMKTILELTGADTTQFEGVNLQKNSRQYALFQRGPRQSDLEQIRSYNDSFDIDSYHKGRVDGIRGSEWKYLNSPDREELFKLPDERNNVKHKYQDIASEMKRNLEMRIPQTSIGDEQRADFTEEMHGRLEDLGYK